MDITVTDILSHAITVTDMAATITSHVIIDAIIMITDQNAIMVAIITTTVIPLIGHITILAGTDRSFMTNATIIKRTGTMDATSITRKLIA